MQMVHVMIAYLIVAYLYISVLLWSVALGMRLLCEVNGMLFILGKTDSRVSPHWVQKISLLQESQERDDHQVCCPTGTCSHTIDLHMESLC